MLILPAVTPLTEPYWAGARDGKLLFQQCRVCHTNWHPPMPICPACHSSDYEWVAAKGQGSIYTYTIVQHATHPSFQDKIPYVVAVVELDEGPRIVMNVRNCDVQHVKGGMRVSVFFEKVTPDVTLPQAQPA